MNKETINTRLKTLKKMLNLNQTEFSKRIGLTQTSLSAIEVGTNSMNDRNIKLVCSTFNVNEKWLRYGEGEMFDSSPYVKEFDELFDSLTPETQDYLLEIARGLLSLQKKLLNEKTTLNCEI